MKVLVGRMSDRGAFAKEAPTPEANLTEWTEPRSGGVRFAAEGGQAVRQPDVSVRCRAWAVEVESMEHFVALLDSWRVDHAASVAVEVRDRGRTDNRDLLVVLEDYESLTGNDYIPACVVEDIG